MQLKKGLGNNVFVSDSMRAALIGSDDPRRTVLAIRRRARNDGDAFTAAGCLLQLVVYEPPEGRLKILRRYARATGSRLAIHTLATQLEHRRPRSNREDDMVRMLRDAAPTPPAESEVLRAAFGPIRFSAVRAWLLRVLDRGRMPSGALTPVALVALLELVDLESAAGEFERARQLAEELARQQRTSLTLVTLALAYEATRQKMEAVDAYRKAAKLAGQEKNHARRRSIEAKLRALAGKRVTS